MEIIGGIVLSLVLLVLLAGLGLVTVAGLTLMIIFGLLTNMSFKRLFFVSFGLGLLAPLLLAGATIAAIEDGSLERDLRQELGDVVTLPEDMGGWSGNWRDTVQELERIGRERDRGELTDEQAEQQLRELFGGSEGAPLRMESGEGENTITIQVD